MMEDFQIDSGSIYTGQMKQLPNGSFSRCGKGRIELGDGSTYEGDWQNDCMHGYGIINHISGYVYQGSFNDDKANG